MQGQRVGGLRLGSILRHKLLRSGQKVKKKTPAEWSKKRRNIFMHGDRNPLFMGTLCFRVTETPCFVANGIKHGFCAVCSQSTLNVDEPIHTLLNNTKTMVPDPVQPDPAQNRVS